MNHALGHLGVAVYALHGLETFGLDGTSTNHTLTDGRAGLARVGLRNFLEGHGDDLHLDVDAVEQRTADLVHVAVYLAGRADAVVRGVAIVAAGTGVHAGHEHETAREVDVILGTRDGDVAVFEGLAQHFERVLVELGQLVAEEHAVVGQRNLAGAQRHTAANQGDVGYGVVRTAKRPARYERRFCRQFACNGVNLRSLQALRQSQLG